MFVNYFWQQCITGIRDVLGHLAGLLCIKFREDIFIINVARPVLLEFAKLADSPIYPPSSIHLFSQKVQMRFVPGFAGASHLGQVGFQNELNTLLPF
jgi:hypothetical protein